VPTKAQAELLLAGLVPASAGGEKQTKARLGIAQGRTILLDKRLEGGAKSVGADLGALSPTCPERQRLLGGGSAPRFERGVLELGPSMDLTYFQCARPDQRFAAVSVDGEQLLLQGLHPRRKRLALRLPRGRAAAAVAAGAHRTQVVLRCDTVLVDLDEERVLLLWRGQVPIDAGCDLAALAVEASLDWGDADRTAGRVLPKAASTTAGDDAHTLVLADLSATRETEPPRFDPQQVLRRVAATPFRAAKAHEVPPSAGQLPPSDSGTVELDETAHNAGSTEGATPFDPPSITEADATMSIDPERAQPAPAVPFADARAPLPPAPGQSSPWAAAATPAAHPTPLVSGRSEDPVSPPPLVGPESAAKLPDQDAPHDETAPTNKPSQGRRWGVGPQPGPIGQVRPGRRARRSGGSKAR
jgi:hypothetical protein